MLFREGGEAVMFLGAVNLTTEAMLAFIGTVLGLTGSVAFGVMFVKGSLGVDLRRFFAVTEWVVVIFVVQLAVNGYHEFSEAGVLPATQRSMALVGPIVRNNTLFIIALVAIPLLIWLTRKPAVEDPSSARSLAQERLAVARERRERFYRHGAVVSSLLVIAPVAIAFAIETMPKEVPVPGRSCGRVTISSWAGSSRRCWGRRSGRTRTRSQSDGPVASGAPAPTCRGAA